MLKFAERVLYHILKSWVGNKSDVKIFGECAISNIKMWGGE